MLDTAPLSAARKVSNSANATHVVSHDATRQPAQTCAPEEIGAVASPAVAPIPDSTKTRRATLFRRALVDSRSVRHARGDMGMLLAFARRPPPLAATWRARYGFRLGFAHRVPKTPRRPPVVAHPRHPSKYDHLTFRHAREQIAIAVFSHLLMDGFGQSF